MDNVNVSEKAKIVDEDLRNHTYTFKLTNPDIRRYGTSIYKGHCVVKSKHGEFSAMGIKWFSPDPAELVAIQDLEVDKEYLALGRVKNEGQWGYCFIVKNLLTKS